MTNFLDKAGDLGMKMRTLCASSEKEKPFSISYLGELEPSVIR